MQLLFGFLNVFQLLHKHVPVDGFSISAHVLS